MIIVEKILDEVFSQLPLIDGFKPVYDWGDSDNLIKQLILFSAESKSPYPLIYQTSTGSTQTRATHKAYTDLVLLLACRNTDTSLVNRNRWAMSYQNILYPLYDNLVLCFERAGIFQYDLDISVKECPNYRDIKNDAKQSIDIWDALEVRVNNLSISNDCIRTIKF
jgi:hypothetical protein